MTTLQMALIGIGNQETGILITHTADDPPSMVLLLPKSDPQVAVWLAALAEGIAELGGDFSVAWVGTQAQAQPLPN